MRKLIIIAAFLVCSVPSWASWSVTNDKQNYCGAGVTSCADTAFSASLTNGSVIVVIFRYLTSAATPLTGCNDTAGNSYSLAEAGFDTGALFPSGGPFLAVFTANNTHTTASNVVTCGVTNASSLGLEAFELTGGSSNVDGYAGTNLHNATCPGANVITFTGITTTQNGDFVFAILQVNNDFSPWSAGTSPVTFTLMPGAIVMGISEYNIQTSAGAIAPTEGCAGSGFLTYGGITIAFSTSVPVSRHRGQVINSQ